MGQTDVHVHIQALCCVQGHRLIYVNMRGVVFRTVCLGHLGVWGELASHKRLFNPPSQFSRLGIQVSPLYIYVCLFVWDGRY